jgi:hypothetical protein
VLTKLAWKTLMKTSMEAVKTISKSKLFLKKVSLTKPRNAV